MIASLRALVRRSLTELALFGFGAATALRLAIHRATGELLAVGFLVAATTLRALAVMHRAGTLRLAWRCPHVDALNLPLPHDSLTWRACEAAEEVLAALEGHARGYRDFFPTARRDVRTALVAALRPHASVEELEATVRALRDIAARLQAVHRGARDDRPLQALESLAVRSQALAAAVEELAPRDNVVPLRTGVRP